ncbi:hypothetical protein E4N72_08065 [Treponema vincentii]|nr:hypothetical protein E4N72_08065 [Treponema vincentii]
MSNSERNPFKNLIHDGDQPDRLNDIVQEADSTEKKALHKGIYKESCTYSTYIEEENINNKIT